MTQDAFFQVGGTLESGHPSYVERPADAELIECLEKNEIPLVLAPRQTGKSSLMVNARGKLYTLGFRSAVVDLQPLGNHTELDQWLSDVIYQIERSLGLSADTLSWWDDHRRLGPTQRFITFVEDVILGEINGRVVIFFDEIDSALPLPFSDDFFTTLRTLANARADNPTLKRLTYVLIGVAIPSDFIKDRSRTPFNIGREITLTDFSQENAGPFRMILGSDSDKVIGRIFYWTAGQPLMVQALCEKMYGLPQNERTVDNLDHAVHDTYLERQIKKSTHLYFIRNYLLDKHHHPRKTLKIYKAVLSGTNISHDERSPVHARLLLSGVVRLEEGRLVARNRIYQSIFDRQWIKENLPSDRVTMVAYASSTGLVLVLLWFFIIQPLVFPTFVKIQNLPWMDSDIHYVTQSDISLPISMLLPEPRKITLNGKVFQASSELDKIKGGQMSIDFNHLRIGANSFTIRFYGKPWKANVEADMTIVYYPKFQWQVPDQLEMVSVPGGCFDMGCGDWADSCSDAEKPVHRVCLSTFEIGKFEVTQAQWALIMGFNPSYFGRGGRLPVEHVSWHDVQDFIQRLNAVSGQQYRLPTEAQWEYAARSGGKPEKYAGGNDLKQLGWYEANSNGKTHEAGGKLPNGLGIYDMSGNVWEWCSDWYDRYSEGASRDPIGPASGAVRIGRASGAVRVVRGGAFGGPAEFCRSAARDGILPSYRDLSLGFRLVLLPGQQGKSGQ